MSLFVVVTHVHSYSFPFYFGLKHHSCPSFSDSRPRGERARARLTMWVQERAIYRMQIPLLHFNVLWPDSEGGKSLTKLLLQSSTFFSPLVLPLLAATLIPFSLPACLWWDWFCRLGEYFMLWCYIQELHSTAPLIRKCKVLLLLKEVKNPFICPWRRLSSKYIRTPNSHL